MTTTDDSLERELEKLYAHVPPPPGGLTAGRGRMLAEAARLKAQFTSLSISNAAKTQEPDRRRKMKLFLAYKIIAAVVAVVMGTTAAGGGIVLASADSLPGDTLYSVKLIVEDTRLALTADPADRAELILSFAAQRTEEIGRLMAQGESVPEDTLARMARHTEQIMVQIAHAQQEDIPGLLERVVERTRAQEQVLEQARTLVPEGTEPALRWALEVTERTSDIASAALRDPERFREEYRHRDEGTPGPDDGASSSRTPVLPCETCTPGRDRDRDRDRNEDQTHTPQPTATATPSPSGPCGTCTPVQDRDRDRDRDRTHAPERTATPMSSPPSTSMPTHTPSPAGPCETCTPEQDRDRDRDRDGDRTHTPSPTMTTTPSPPPASMPTNTPEPTTGPMPSPTSVPRPTHTPEPKSTHTPMPEPTHTPKHGGHVGGH